MCQEVGAHFLFHTKAIFYTHTWRHRENRASLRCPAHTPPLTSLLMHASDICKPLGLNQPLGTVIWFWTPDSKCHFQKCFPRIPELTLRAVVTFWEDELVKRTWGRWEDSFVPHPNPESRQRWYQSWRVRREMCRELRRLRVSWVLGLWVVTAQLQILKRGLLFRLCLT